MPNNELQELLGARFKEHTHPTNEAVWSAIEAQLDTEKSDRAAIWFWIFNGIAATLLIGMMFQSSDSYAGFNSTLPQLSEKTTVEASTPEANESALVKQDENLQTTELNRTDLNPGSSSMNQEGIFDNQIDNSTILSKVDKAESRIEQTIELPEVSTNYIDGGFVVSTSNRGEINDLSVDNLSTFSLIHPTEKSTINSCIPAITVNKTSGYFKRLPIHFGMEFSYLSLKRVPTDAIGILDSSGAKSYDALAYNRHFELSLFSQFDFTNRFSASLGLGYSHSKASSSSNGISSASINSQSTESELNLLTVPLQTKINFFRKKRIALSGGLTFQGEFGRIAYTETQVDASWVTTTVPPELAEQSTDIKTIDIRQFAVEPYLQFSVNLNPRISSFVNLGYKMYLNQTNPEVFINGRLNYFNADFGLMFRLR